MNYGKDDHPMISVEESERRQRKARQGKWCEACASTGQRDGKTCLSCNGTSR